jgi:hypothetical protein
LCCNYANYDNYSPWFVSNLIYNKYKICNIVRLLRGFKEYKKRTRDLFCPFLKKIKKNSKPGIPRVASFFDHLNCCFIKRPFSPSLSFTDNLFSFFLSHPFCLVTEKLLILTFRIFLTASLPSKANKTYYANKLFYIF